MVHNRTHPDRTDEVDLTGSLYGVQFIVLEETAMKVQRCVPLLLRSFACIGDAISGASIV